MLLKIKNIFGKKLVMECQPKKYWQDWLDIFRITNLQAAVGQTQLEKAYYFKKRWIAKSICKN